MNREEQERAEYERQMKQAEMENLIALNSTLEQQVNTYNKAFDVLKVAGIVTNDQIQMALKITGWKP